VVRITLSALVGRATGEIMKTKMLMLAACATAYGCTPITKIAPEPSSAVIANFEGDALRACEIYLGWTKEHIRTACGAPMAVVDSANEPYRFCYIYESRAHSFAGGGAAPYVAACFAMTTGRAEPGESPYESRGNVESGDQDRPKLTVERVVRLKSIPADLRSAPEDRGASSRCPEGKRACPGTRECIPAQDKCEVEAYLEKQATKRTKETSHSTGAIIFLLIGAVAGLAILFGQ
tara:strand:- start:22 stop:726 length:705 start_codon:yes stop_codon:yes gene_type:complete